MEVKVDPNNYDIKDFVICKPMKTKIGFNYNIVYKSKDFIYQTPICKILETDNEKYCKIIFDYTKNFSHFEFLNDIENKVKQNNYKSCIEYNEEEIIINVKLIPKSEYYNKIQERISKYNLKIGDKVILLLNTNGIWKDETSSTMRWNCSQLIKLNNS